MADVEQAPEGLQVPANCRHCQFWHGGDNSKGECMFLCLWREPRQSRYVRLSMRLRISERSPDLHLFTEPDFGCISFRRR